MANKLWLAQKRRLKEVAREAEEAEAERAASEKNERYRYLPASCRAFDDLVESVGDETAARIQSLIEAMIAERHDR